MRIRSHRDLETYQLAFEAAVEIFEMTGKTRGRLDDAAHGTDDLKDIDMNGITVILAG